MLWGPDPNPIFVADADIGEKKISVSNRLADIRTTLCWINYVITPFWITNQSIFPVLKNPGY